MSAKTNGNGKPKQGATGNRVAGNGDKKLGGVTGKGFKPGQSGNPSGSSRRQKEAQSLGADVRKFLSKVDHKDPAKRLRIECAIDRLYQEDLRTLFAYGFGKPVEMMELAGAEGAPVEFRIAVTGAELP